MICNGDINNQTVIKLISYVVDILSFDYFQEYVL